MPFFKSYKFKKTPRGRALRKKYKPRRGRTGFRKKAPRWSGTSKFSKRKQVFHNRVQRALNSIAETQFKSYATGVSPAEDLSGFGIEESLTPLQLAQDSNKYQVSFNLGGTVLQRQAPELPVNSGVGMFDIQANERNGSYVSMIKNRTRLLISRNPIFNEVASANLSTIERTALLSQPMNFRVMVIKPNMKYHTTITSPNDTCWLSPNGTDTGYDTTKYSSLNFNNLLMNKKNFTVIRDQRFRLSPPSTVTDATLNNPSAQRGVFTSQWLDKYPSQKQIDFVIPINRKIYYSDINYTPLNLADTCYVIVTATYPNSSKPMPCNYWRVDFTSTTSYTDF